MTEKKTYYLSHGAHTATITPKEDGSWSLDVVELTSNTETETSYSCWGDDIPADEFPQYLPALLKAGWKQHESREAMNGDQDGEDVVLKPVTGELREQVQGEEV